MTRSDGLAFRDNPQHPQRFSSLPGTLAAGRSSLRAGRPRPDHHRLAHERPRGLRRKRIEDNFERRRIRHTAVTLTIEEFGLNSAIIGFGEKVHSARGLHAKVRRASRNCSRKQEGDRPCLTHSLRRRSPGTIARRAAFYICPARLPSCSPERDVFPCQWRHHREQNNAICRERRTGAFHIEDVFPSIDGGRFAVKRIVGEPVEVWADIYRDGHEVIAAALVWRREVDREWRREPMTMHSNDRWRGSFVPDAAGPPCLRHRGLDR